MGHVQLGLGASVEPSARLARSLLRHSFSHQPKMQSLWNLSQVTMDRLGYSMIILIVCWWLFDGQWWSFDTCLVVIWCSMQIQSCFVMFNDDWFPQPMSASSVKTNGSWAHPMYAANPHDVVEMMVPHFWRWYLSTTLYTFIVLPRNPAQEPPRNHQSHQSPWAAVLAALWFEILGSPTLSPSKIQYDQRREPLLMVNPQSITSLHSCWFSIKYEGSAARQRKMKINRLGQVDSKAV